MSCDIDRLSDRQWYNCSNFLEVSTVTKSNVAPGHSKGAQNVYAIQVE